MSQHLALINAIDQVERQNDPKQLFELLPEDVIWSSVDSILQDRQNSYRTIILLLAIEKNFNKLRNKKRVADIILQSMDLSVDSLVYEKAQRIVLNYVKQWQKDENRKFHRKFEDDYQNTYRGDNKFVAELAIEGAILLPIFLRDKLKLGSTIDLVRDEFPSIPAQRQSPAYLVVKILKLLRYSYDVLTDSEEVIEIFKDNLNSNNNAVEAEASFALGVTDLYKAFRAEDDQTLQQALSNAREWFENAQLLQGNRTDAELFLKISNLYLQLLYSVNADRLEIVSLIRQVQNIVVTRFLLNQARYPYIESSEFKLVNFINTLEQWINLIQDAKKWPDIKPPMKLLADIYASHFKYSLDQDLADKAIRSSVKWIALPNLKTKFLEIQEIEAKLTSILSDNAWLQIATEQEIEFYRYILQEISATLPKAQTVAQWESLQAAVNQFDSTGELWKSIEAKEPSDAILQIMAIQQQRWQPFSEPLNKQVRDISRELLGQLQLNLQWKTTTSKWSTLKYITERIVKYFYELSIADNIADFSFLYAKDRGGQGQDAKEGDLQKHFYLAMRWNSDVTLEYEPKNVAVGRPDLLFRCIEDLRFPIEVKCEADNISRDNIRNKYLAQAQEYAADSNQVSFLFVLDTTRKSIGKPKLDIRDYCYVDSLHNDMSKHTNCVVVLIFRANRFSPSVHSWESHKKRKS